MLEKQNQDREELRYLVRLVEQWQLGSANLLDDVAKEVKTHRSAASELQKLCAVIQSDLSNIQGSLASLWEKFNKCFEARADRNIRLKNDIMAAYEKKDDNIIKIIEDFKKEVEFFKREEYGKLRDRVLLMVGGASVISALITQLIAHLLKK